LQRDPKVKLDKGYHVGQALRTRIIKIDPNDRKIGLTTRDVEPLTDEEQTNAGGTTAPPASDEPTDDSNS
jgi:ribosomal protein S1